MTEVWDPRETPRRLTMFEEPEGAPFVLAYCEPRFWDGFYVPVLSLQLLAFHWGQCAATDPNGEWWATAPRLGVDWNDWMPHHDIAGSVNDVVVIPHYDGDPSLALIYEPVGKIDGILQYAFDRLPWRDA
jgi:hypothetical protein